MSDIPLGAHLAFPSPLHRASYTNASINRLRVSAAHNARKRFRLIANGDPEKKREGICPGATPHSLRHAPATILLEEGVPMRVVSELFGHSSRRITEDVYSHVKRAWRRSQPPHWTGRCRDSTFSFR